MIDGMMKTSLKPTRYMISIYRSLKDKKKGINKMAKSFKTLKAGLSEERQTEIAVGAKKLMEAMPLYELRQARLLSQEQLAQLLNIRQPNVSKIEKRADMYISTLRSFIKAMGGELDIVARFPEGDVKINQFVDIEEKPITPVVTMRI
jgi:predicted XRE-type DNA-binding protein